MTTTNHTQLIDDIADTYTAETDAKSKSIRTMASLLSGYNQPILEEEEEPMALAIATKVSGGNPNILKTRKSETLLLIRQRSCLASVLLEHDNQVQSRAPDDKPINIRAAVLAAARIVKKSRAGDGPVVTGTQAMQDYVRTCDGRVPRSGPGPSTSIKRALKALASNTALHVDTKGTVHPLIVALSTAITAAMDGDGLKALNTLSGELTSPDGPGSEDVAALVPAQPGQEQDLLKSMGLDLATTAPDEPEPEPNPIEFNPSLRGTSDVRKPGTAKQARAEHEQNYDLSSFVEGLL